MIFDLSFILLYISMTLFKKIGWWLLLLAIFGATFAANPSYNFLPASGSELKLHCNYNWNLSLLAWWQNYNAFESTISYDSSNISLTHSSVNSPFTQNQGYSLIGNLYKTYGALPGGQMSSSDVNAVNFGFKTLNNISSSTLSFTDRLGNTITFWPATTDDGATLNGFDVNGADILTAAYDASYTFVPLPCVPDANVPKIDSNVPAGGSRYIPSNQIISFLAYDWIGESNVTGPSPLASNNTRHYWYGGWATLITNYVVAPANVDNQEWVNSSTIQATVSCATCDSFGWPYVLTASNLIINDWLWDWSRNQYTWDSQIRGYEVSFAAPAAYEIEKLVTVSLQATDNPNENWQVHTWITNFSFNAPLPPTISRLLPSGTTFISPSKTNVIRLFVSDDWAWIDTGTLKITIPTIMSWAEQLLTWYTYSWSELYFTLSWWSEWLGNSGKYVVDFYSNWDFPANQLVTITWAVSDLAGNIYNSFSTSFTTRPDCSYFGCNEILNIDILDGGFAGLYEFTWTILVVTGTNPDSPYPYLTGLNNDILMCGYEWTGAILTGNVQIYDTTGDLINGSIYSGDVLYITGLNFTIVDWVIIVQ